MDSFIKAPLYDANTKTIDSSIIDKYFFYDLMVAHYIKIPRWKKMCENGFMFLKQTDQNQLVSYKDRFNKKELTISYNRKICIYEKSTLLFAEDYITKETIFKILEYMSLSDGMKHLILDLADVYEYEGLERMNHPIRKAVFKQRELAIKLLFVFCVYGGGITSKQLIHLVNILQELEMSEELVCESIKKIIEMDEKSKKEVSMKIAEHLGEEEKKYVIRDLCYLLELGDYSIETDDKYILLISECFGLEETKIENLRYKIKKEYING